MFRFRKFGIAIFCLFMGIMVFVTSTAYARRSGNTGIDAAKIQKMRMDHG